MRLIWGGHSFVTIHFCPGTKTHIRKSLHDWYEAAGDPILVLRRLCPRGITPQSSADAVPVRHYPNSWDCGIFRISPASKSVRNRKISSDPRGGAQAPPRTARRSPRQSGSHCSERHVREPAAFYVRSRDHLDVVADDPDCYLPALPGAPTAPKMVSVHFLDCSKDGLDDAALVVLAHEPGQLVPVRSGHIAPGLAAPVLADGIGLGPDARYHALVGYGVADLPG